MRDSFSKFSGTLFLGTLVDTWNGWILFGAQFKILLTGIQTNASDIKKPALPKDIGDEIFEMHTKEKRDVGRSLCSINAVIASISSGVLEAPKNDRNYHSKEELK